MLQQSFINRKNELQVFEERFSSKKPEFIMLYGRRRVGKTELVTHFIHNKPALYFLAEEKMYLDNLNEMRGIMADFLKNEEFKMIKFDSWVQLFKSFLDKVDGRIAIIIDEFPYLVKGNAGVPSEFQKIWDMYLSKSDKVMLSLVGSSISVMEELLGRKSPLFGRRTAQLEIKPVTVFQIKDFLPNYTIEDCINAYGCIDGIPLYLRQFSDKLTFFENMKAAFFRRDAMLYSEAEILMNQEFREPANYFAILKAISFGYTKQNEMSDYANIDKSIISKYVKNLEKIRVIHRQFPVTERKEKQKSAKYAFSDNYFMFWFRYVYPNKTSIEQGITESLGSVKETYGQYLGKIFEKAAADYLWKARPFSFAKLGRWWHKDNEIDLVALDEAAKNVFFFECKWMELTESGARNILQGLKKKSQLVDWNNSGRKEHFGLFAKRVENKDALRKDGLLVFDLADFEILTSL